MVDKTMSHFQNVLQGGQSMRDCPGLFQQNFDGLPPPLSAVGGGVTSEMKIKNVAVHLHSGTHAFKKTRK